MNTIIESFKGDKNIALIGISTNKQKFGNALLHELTKKGYTVFPLHPLLAEVEGIKCYPDVKTLPDFVTNLILVVNPLATGQIIPQLKDSTHSTGMDAPRCGKRIRFSGCNRSL